jgi:hypothetical protein
MTVSAGEALSEPHPPKVTWRQDLRAIRIIRLALGVTIAMVIAQAWPWPVSFVYVAFCVAILGAPVPGPALKDTFQGIGYAVVVYTVGPVVILFLMSFPIAFVVGYSLLLFLVVYNMQKGARFSLILFAYLALMLFPILTSVHAILPAAAAASMMFSAILALLTAQLAHGLLPDPVSVERAARPGYKYGYVPDAARAALKTAIVVVPVMLVFLLFDLSSAAVVMVYIGIMSLGGGLAAGTHSAKKSIIANVIGGLATLAFYYVMIAVPELFFFAVLMLLTSLLFGVRIFSGTPEAQYYGSALTGLVILVSSSMGADADVDVNVIKRIIFIALAGTYVIIAMTIVERLLPHGRQPAEN